MSKGKFQAVLFDLDGVLVDAKEIHFNALNEALLTVGGKDYFIIRKDHNNYYDGLSTKEKLNLLTKNRGLPKHLHDEIHLKKQKNTIEYINKFCKPILNVKNSVIDLHQRDYRLIVCTNAIRKSCEDMLVISEIFDYFDFIISNEDVKNIKPSPDIYQKAYEKLGLNPEECLAVEDNDYGIQSAKQAGCYVFNVDNPYQVNSNDLLEFMGQYED